MRDAQSKVSRRIVGRLDKGVDLAGGLIEVCKKHGVQAGEVRALGALTHLEVTEWDLDSDSYRAPIVRKDPCEILVLYGNFSLKQGELFPHLHISASYFEDGRTVLIAGHLAKGTVFACEYVIEAFDDLRLERKPDESTGLWLWDKLVSDKPFIVR